MKSHWFFPKIAESHFQRAMQSALLAFVVSGLGFVTSANASERITLPVNLHPVWHSECTSCHPLYPPKLLTQSDWKALMTRLDKHFGVNADVDEATREIITQALVADASPDSASNHHADSLRITDTPWHLVRHKGRRKVEGRNISNCNNCHKNEDDQLW